MSDTNKLHDMLDSIVDDNSEQAQVNFHDYLVDKMKTDLGLNSLSSPTTPEVEQQNSGASDEE